MTHAPPSLRGRRPPTEVPADLDAEGIALLREARAQGADGAGLVLRGLRALTRALPHLDEEGRAYAQSRETDEESVAVLLAALPAPVDPLQRARMRGYERVRALSQSDGGCISAIEVANLLGITRQGVDWKRKSRHLLAANLPGRRGWVYPTWQLAGGAPLVGMDLVLEALESAGISGWSAVQFFLSPADGSGVRPLDALRQGEIGAVLRVARLLGGQGPL